MTGQTAEIEAQQTAPAEAAAMPDAGGLVEQAVQVLAGYRIEALTGWVWRLEQQQPPPRVWPDLCLSDVVGEPPVLLDTVVGALRSGSAGAFLADSPDTAARLHRQLTFRLLQGAPLNAVLNEQALLRDEVWALFTRRLPALHRPAEVLALARALDGALQRVLELAILAAVERPEQSGELAAA